MNDKQEAQVDIIGGGSGKPKSDTSKTEIMKEKFFNRANISLFTVAFVATLLTAVISWVCGGERLTTVFLAPIGGVSSILGVGALCEIEDLELPVGPGAGILGVVTGALLTIIIF